MDGRARVLTAVLALACAGLLSACTPALAGKAGFAVGPDGEALLVAASCGNGAPGSAVAGLAVVVEVDIDLEPEPVYVVTGWDRGTLVRMSNNLYRTRATTEQIRALDPGQVLVDEDDIGRPVVTVEEFLVIACGNPPTVPA